MKRKIPFFTKVLLFCSGTTFDLIRKCPRFEVNKYASIGLTVLFTAILSILSSYFAFKLIFDSEYLAIPLSFFWGCIIFNLDRYIVSSMRMNESKWKEIIKSIPRILIAFLIAVIISKPLEIKLFDSEIQVFLEKEKINQMYGVSKKYTPDIELIESKRQLVELDFQKSLALRDKYYEEYKCECTGTCGTNVKGYGRECKSRKKRYDIYLSELSTKRAKKDSIIRLFNKEELKLKDLMEIEKTVISSSKIGFFDKIKALNKINKLGSFFILLMFIMIETAPLLTKLLSQKGPYDNLVLEDEIRFEANYLKQVDNFDQERMKNKKMKQMSASLELKSKEAEIKNILKNEAFDRYEKMRRKVDNKSY